MSPPRAQPDQTAPDGLAPARISRRQRLGLLAAAAAHVVLMWAPFEWSQLWPLIFLAPAPLAWMAVRAPSTRFAVLTAIAAHIILWAVVSRWMIQVTTAGFPGYVLAMAAWNGGMFVWVFRRVHGQALGTGHVALVPNASCRMPRLPMAITLPLVWVAIEALRGEFIADGYPWYFLAHPVVEATVLAQSADLFGAYFISFLVAMTSGALLDLVKHGGPRQATEEEQKRLGDRSNTSRATGSIPIPFLRGSLWPSVVTLCAVVGVHIANLAYGAYRMNQTEPLSDGPAMLVIQTNLPQDNKMRWTLEQQQRDLYSFLRQSIRAFHGVDQGGEGSPVDVIVWPETMLPGFGLEPESVHFLAERGFEVPVHFANEIVGLAQMFDTPVLVGSPAFLDLHIVEDDDGVDRFTWSAQYNSAYLIQNDPPFQRYDKVFLTPFGETMPYISNWPGLEQRLLAIGARGMTFDLDHGEELRTLNLNWRGGETRLATPICFEVTVGWLNRRLVYDPDTREKRADILVNVTNDGWFGFHAAGRIQHAQMSRYRAIENRVPMVRSANTGVSVSIDSAGRLVDVIGEGPYGEPKRADHLYTQVMLDARSTLYGRIGELWAWMCVAVTAVLFALTWFGPRPVHRRDDV